MTKKLLVFGLMFLFLTSGIYAQKKGSLKPKQIAVEAIADIENENAQFLIDLRLEEEKETYKVGEKLAVIFKANKDCYLTLLNVATDGQVYKIFPNEHQNDNFVKANEEYRVPAKDAKFLLKVKSPSGKDVIKAIATLKNVQVVEDTSFKQEGEVQVATKGEKTIAVEIVQNLQKIEAKDWAEAEKIINVKE